MIPLPYEKVESRAAFVANFWILSAIRMYTKVDKKFTVNIARMQAWTGIAFGYTCLATYMYGFGTRRKGVVRYSEGWRRGHRGERERVKARNGANDEQIIEFNCKTVGMI